MNKKLQPTLLALALAASFGANAVVYKIENIDELYKVNGTISNHRSGSGVTLNDNDVFIGGASGKYSPSLSQSDLAIIDNNSVDVAITAISTSASNISTNPTRAVKTIPDANNVIFEFDDEFMPQAISVFEETLTNDIRTVSTINSFAFDISNENIIVGTTSSAAYELPDPDQRDTNADRDFPFYAYDYEQRAMVIDDGRVLTFIPEFSQYGGQSGLTAISGSGYVVGYAGTSLEETSEANIDVNCLSTYADTEEHREADEVAGADTLIVPLQICARGFSFDGGSSTAATYKLEAFSWQYSNGQLRNPTSLGILNSAGDSFAFDVNDAEIAVGRSASDVAALNVAVIYRNEEVIDLMDYTETTWRNSNATSINNNNLAVGFMEKIIDGVVRDKFFIYDVNSEETILTFPNDFTSSASDLASVPNHINDHNMVVGSIEIDSEDTIRQTHAFLYDADSKDFQDINDLLTCESKGFVAVGSRFEKFEIRTVGGEEELVSFDADITIVNAHKVSDDGSIIATALVTLPVIKTQFVDEEGIVITTAGQLTEGTVVEEVVVDAAGDPVFDVDSQGNAITEQILRSVVLTVVDDAEACDVITEDSEEFEVKRQGSGFGLLSLLVLIGGLFARRVRS